MNMLRRDFVRAVVGAGLVPRWLVAQQAANPAPPPPAPVPWTLGLNPKTPLPHTQTGDGIAEPEPRFFTLVQRATLVRLCDVLLPATGDKPGAVAADTPQFLDFLIGASPVARQRVYTGGLNWLEGQAQKSYRKAFAGLDDVQAGALLKPWLRTWMNDHPPTEAHADFLNLAHDDIRTATMNSKAWSLASATGGKPGGTTGLYWASIEPKPGGLNPSFHAEHLRAHVLAAPKAAHSMPSYSR